MTEMDDRDSSREESGISRETEVMICHFFKKMAETAGAEGMPRKEMLLQTADIFDVSTEEIEAILARMED